MFKNKFYSLIIIALAIPFASFGQCNTCVIDSSCISTTGFPSVCPEILPDAIAGVPYEQSITFYMPPTITDPGSGITVDLIAIEVTSISGLPFGMSYTIGDEDGVFYPQSGQNLGCVTLCGTPVLPGDYGMLISVMATVTASGFQFEQPQSFEYGITVSGGSVSGGSFIYDNVAGCDYLDVQFAATFAAPSPAVTTYDWDFGNGTSGADSATVVSYSETGTYEVFLHTIVSGYHLSGVQLNSLSGGWGGDEDILGSPDPYFSIADAGGNTVYTSAVVDNTSSTSWSVDIQLDNPPYTISFFDDDPISNDDALGTANININASGSSFDSGNGTAGLLSFVLQEITSITDSVEITVFPLPSLSIVPSGNTLQANPANLSSYSWTVNDQLQAGENASQIALTLGGEYQCFATNEFGCSAASNVYLFCPQVSISYDAMAQELSVPDQYVSYQWYMNGVLMQGATLFYLIAPAPGTYTVEVTTSYGCTIQSSPFNYTGIGITEQSFDTSFSISPNPAISEILLQSDQLENEWTTIIIYDVSGRKINTTSANFSEGRLILDVSFLEKGYYTILISTADGIGRTKTFVKH